MYELYKNYLKSEGMAVDVNKTYFTILYVKDVTFIEVCVNRDLYFQKV